MYVSKSVSIEINDLVKIDEEIKDGKAVNVSEFVQKAIKNELERD
jgi:Arc/MetJ-type ribon-helix-helix transcriptional regulator